MKGRNGNRSSRQILRRRFGGRQVILGLCLIALLLFAVSSFSDAHGDETKYYESICIQPGDTLSSIAGAYYNERFGSFDAYYYEICRINHLSTDSKLHQDCYLIVPYYE